MAQRAIRFSESTDKGIREATEKRGFSSPTAFIRHAVEQALSGHKEELASSEQRLAASMEQVRQELLALGRTQQALFALVDSLAKILLTCIPEPCGEAIEAAVARAQGRHARLLKSAGQAMVGDSQLAMRELVNRVESRRRVGAVLEFHARSAREGVNDQVFCKKEQPPQPAGRVTLHAEHLPAGTYAFELCQTGSASTMRTPCISACGRRTSSHAGQTDSLRTSANGASVQQGIFKTRRRVVRSRLCATAERRFFNGPAQAVVF